jgi:hypothetical protein
MSFDITFHSFRVDEIQRYLFDVWRDPSRAGARAAELTDDDEKREQIVTTIYELFPRWQALREEGALELDQTVAFACAALSGYAHFYHYARGSALSFAAEHVAAIAALFVPLSHLPHAPPDLGASRGRGALIERNFSASGWIPPERFDDLLRALDALDAQRRAGSVALFSLFDDADRQSLEAAVTAARQRGAGLIEAADLVVPARREGSTDLDKLRLIEPLAAPTPDARRVFPCLSKARGEY